MHFNTQCEPIIGRARISNRLVTGPLRGRFLHAAMHRARGYLKLESSDAVISILSEPGHVWVNNLLTVAHLHQKVWLSPRSLGQPQDWVFYKYTQSILNAVGFSQFRLFHQQLCGPPCGSQVSKPFSI